MPWTAEINQSGLGLAGSVDQLMERIEGLSRLGIDYITLSIPQNDEVTQQLLADEVLPAFSTV